MQIGDIVSEHDESLPRTKWRMGVVHELIKESTRQGEQSSTLLTWERVHMHRLFPLEILDVKKGPESAH